MIDLNVYNLVLYPITGLILYLVYLRFQKPLEYRQVSSHVPSVTKTFWSELKFSWNIAMKHPKGKKKKQENHNVYNLRSLFNLISPSKTLRWLCTVRGG